MTDQAPVSHLVVVGSSAGGIEALSTLVAGLGAAFPAAVVIAQHLDPRRSSRLDEILARRTALPVRTVSNHEALQAGVIFVVPADRHVEITDHAVSLLPGTAGSKPSVDRLFSSAVQTFRERLVAVVLSGTGSDGALGARAVHEAGGTVVIQNPETAAFPGMPRSLAPATVDIVAELEDIGSILQAVVTGGYVPELADGERELRALLAEVRATRGLDFNDYRRPTILRRLQRRMVATRSDTLTEYRRYLRENPLEQDRLISSLLIKVTDFFRDPATFAYLREKVLPGLIEDAAQRQEELRIWSAGCATGEEAYSLAVLVLDLLAEQPHQLRVRIFATDLDSDAIAFARRGVYPARSLAHVPPELVAQYFTASDGEYEVVKGVRDLIVFGEHDLGQRPPFPRTDLVLCRNVLMYFTPDLQKRALQAFAFSLRLGGFMVLGSAEHARPVASLFLPAESRLRIYRRTGERAAFSPDQTGSAALRPPMPVPTRRTPIQPSGAAPLAGLVGPPPRTGLEVLLQQLPVGIVLVNRRYDIQIINPTARQLLGIHGLAVGNDLIHLLDSIAAPAIRSAIDAAFRAEAPASIEEVATAELGLGQRRHLQITCLPHSEQPDRGSVPNDVMVVVIDITDIVRKRLMLEQEQATERDELRRLRELMEKLAETNRKLLAANDQLANAEEALRTTNAEYLAAAAQAQTATEELETNGEELQASNEELETLNEELKSTIEELSLSNADLDARTQELAAQRAESEESQAQLAAILATMGDAVAVVDRSGTPLRTNKAYDALLEQLVQRDAQGTPLTPESRPIERAARRETFSMVFSTTADDGTSRWYEANGQPISSHGLQGGLLVIRDITERSLRRLQEQFLAHTTHELRTPLTALIGFLQLQLQELTSARSNERPRHFGQRALGQAQRLSQRIDELTEVAHLESGKPLLNATVDLTTVASQAVDVARGLAPDRTIECTGATPLQVRGDAGRLEDVLLNLLTNAIKYAPGTEPITVRLREVGHEAEIQVEDRGQGIPATALPHIFTRFYQVARPDRAAERGLGLGLFIAREIVSAHGGSISVQSEPGIGTTFTVRLPLL